MASWRLMAIAGLAVAALFLVVALAVAWRRVRAFPYVRAPALFTPAERAFLGVLDVAAGPDLRVFGKVRIADVLQVRRGVGRSRRQTAFNHIQSKHFDFVVCRRSDLAAVCVIELDDASHASRTAHIRDAFKDHVCAAAHLPLIRVRARRSYSVADVKSHLIAALRDSVTGAPASRQRA